MKYFIYVIFLTYGICYAESDIFKCTDSSGNITYSNDSKSGTCEKTGLGIVNKANVVNKLVSEPLAPQGTNDKSLKDQKRKLILQGELTQEKQQLESISDMIAKTEDKDQISRLTEMQNMHKRNINALQKEIGYKTDVELLLPTNIGRGIPGKDVPISLPSRDSNIDDSKGIISQVFDVFRNTSKKRQIQPEQSIGQPINQELPLSVTKTTDYNQQQTTSPVEPERIKLETNLITNKSIRSKP